MFKNEQENIVNTFLIENCTCLISAINRGLYQGMLTVKVLLRLRTCNKGGSSLFNQDLTYLFSILKNGMLNYNMLWTEISRLLQLRWLIFLKGAQAGGWGEPGFFVYFLSQKQRLRLLGYCAPPIKLRWLIVSLYSKYSHQKGASIKKTWAAPISAKGKNSSAGASLIFITTWTFFCLKNYVFFKQLVLLA